MFKEWFAQFNWQGLSFLGFAAVMATLYFWKVKKRITGRQAGMIAGGIVALFFVLWILGLRW